MPKKTSKPKKKTIHSLRLTFIILGSFLLLLGLSVFLQLQGKTAIASCANSISCINDLSGKKEEANTGEFMGKLVKAPNIPEKPLFALSETQSVLGESTEDYKHIYVNLTNQTLSAYEGNSKIYEFPISSGKWGRTPTGDFRIWTWLRYTRMSGGSTADGTYYNLPNVPYTMFFYNTATPKHRGFGIHGAYWHDNFGRPMSHGCINMRTEDAGKIFYWTNPTGANTAYPAKNTPGTLITIYGTAPNE